MRICFIILLAIISSSCSFRAPEEEWIQGTWQYDQTIWIFDYGKYEIQGKMSEKGYYRFIKSAGQTLSIEIQPRNSNASRDAHIMKIVVDNEKKTLIINDEGPFTKAQ
ncbi:hypothetical protein K1X84_14640 [bacterium]|nr:hypothetical protein [bacterium]